MRLGTKILLLMLLITVGTSLALAWVVTLNFTRYETRRADEEITRAIGGYVSHLEDRHRQIEKIVRALLEAPAARSQLQAADEAGDAAAREQLKQEIFGRTVQTELTTQDGAPAFHVVLNLAGEVLFAVSPGDPNLEQTVGFEKVRWPIDSVIDSPKGDTLVSYYVSTPAGLFLAMGIPLHTQLDQPPSQAYFVGFRVDDRWVRRQLLSGTEITAAASSRAPLTAWFLVDGQAVARASADPNDSRVNLFSPKNLMQVTEHHDATTRALGESDTVKFKAAGERYVGQTFDLSPAGAKSGRLILASSLDQALLPLKSLQRQIVLCAAVACLIGAFASQLMARRIAKPIRQLVEATERVSEGQFDKPVAVSRRDELGALGHAFNEMAEGLKERDALRDEHTKMQRELALARKIQMDVLPKHIPPCPGYDIAVHSHPAEQTGGDIYDLVAVALDAHNHVVDNGRDDASPTLTSSASSSSCSSMVLLLADATGHGMGPALSVTQVRSMLRIGVRLRAGLDHVLSQINRQLCEDLGAGRFVTAFLGMLDARRHAVRYHSAGQAPLLHFSAADRELRWLDSSTLPLGIDENPYDEGVQHIGLQPGDLLVLLTDGFYEFQNPAGDQFSQDRVADVVRQNHARPAEEILSAMLRATRSFADGAPQMDDMTALIIKRLPGDDVAACATSS